MSNILTKFLEWEQTAPNDLFLRQPIQGRWKHYSYREAGDEIRRIAAGLKELPPRSHVAILSRNCAHWIMADLAIMMCGHVSVPLYATSGAAVISQILRHAEARAIVVGKLDNYSEQQAGIPPDVLRIGIGIYGVQETHQWEDWLRNEPLTEYYNWSPDELFTIIYTSGTTGVSKGVMHRVGGFDSVAMAGITDLNIPERLSLLSYLPLSHVAERIGIETVGIYLGAQFTFTGSVETFGRDLMDTQPHLFFAVPRIWSKFREKVLEKVPQKKLDRLLRVPVIGSIVKRRIRKNLGLSRASLVISGAAPLSVELLQWFSSIGVTIFQGYGLTENCATHFNRPAFNSHGTVGIPLGGILHKIAADGEIRIKSPGDMMGYYNEPAQTAEMFDEQRYLRTGDIGNIGDDGVLTVTGRLKDQFKTDKGKYISPAPIEVKFSVSADIDQVCVVGMGIPQPIALVVLSDSGLKKERTQLSSELSALLNDINAGLESYEKLKKVVVMTNGWSIGNGLLTPTLKVRRNEIEKMKLPYYPDWYRASETVVWE